MKEALNENPQEKRGGVPLKNCVVKIKVKGMVNNVIEMMKIDVESQLKGKLERLRITDKRTGRKSAGRGAGRNAD